MKLKWLSTLLGSLNGPIWQLRPAELLSLASTSSRMTIVSAYFDVKFLESVAAAIPLSRRRHVWLRVLLNASSGQRRVAELEVLRKLEARWKTKFPKATIRLVRQPGLFHSKLLVFERRGRVSVLVGSANATSAAYDSNEELMLRLEGPALPTAVSHYLQSVERHSRSLAEQPELLAGSLPSLLRSGILYYQPKAIAQFRFDLRIPPRTRVSLNRLSLRVPGIAARSTGLTYDPVSGLSGLANEGSSGRLLLRPEAIQTCYGWWVPEAYRGQVEAKIEASSRARRVKLSRLVRALRIGITNGAVLRRARKNFRQLHSYLDRHRLKAGEAIEERLTRFEGHLSRVSTKINNEKWVHRAASALEPASVPEVWDDVVAAEYFVDSFFEYVEFANAGGKVPLVVKSLRQRATFSVGVPAQEIRMTVEAELKRAPWSSSDWLER